MLSQAEAMGILIGALVGIILCFFLFKYMNRDKKLKTQYDEMQQKTRGKAFCYSFYTVMIIEALMIFVSLFDLNLPMTDAVVHFTIIVIGVMVLACYCIWNDAYVGLNTNMKRYGVIMLIAGAINLASAIAAIAGGRMLVGGKLQAPFINMLCAIMLIAIALVLLAKKISDAHSGEGDFE